MTVGGFYSRGNRSVKRYFLRLRDFTKIRKYPKRPKEWTRIKGCFRTCRVLMTPTSTGKPPSTPAGMHILCHFFAVGRQLFLIEGEDRSEVEQMKRRFYGRGVFTRNHWPWPLGTNVSFAKKIIQRNNYFLSGVWAIVHGPGVH